MKYPLLLSKARDTRALMANIISGVRIDVHFSDRNKGRDSEEKSSELKS